MAIAYVSSSNISVLTATITVTAPTGITDGCIMVAILNTSSTLDTITPPTGWAQIDTVTNNGFVTYTYWKRAASESGNYTWTGTGSVRKTCAISVFSGCIATGSPIDTHSIVANGFGTANPATTITPTSDNSMIVYFGDQASTNSRTWTPNAGYTEAADSASQASVCIDYLLQTSAAATGAVSATASSTGFNSASLLALKPPVVAGSTGNFFLFFNP